MKDLRLLLPLFLLILIIFIFTGCGGVIPSPGTTDDFTTISGQIKMPLDCCTILPEEANSISKTAETCDESDLWSVTPGAIVELKSAEKGKCNKVLDTTIADETGNYVFEDVKPGLYIITAYCPVEDDKGFLTKDVAEKLSGQALDAGIPDCTSTALALVIEKINDCYDEHYQCFNKYSEAYKMVKGIAQDIGTVDISAIISHDDFGSYCDEEGDDLVDVICAWPCCIGPGTTGGGGNITPTPTYNLKMAVEPEGSGIATDKTGKSPYRKNTEVNILAAPNEGWKFTGWTVADDTKSLSRAPAGSFTDASKANTTFTMPANDVIVTANFVGQCAGNTAPVITVPDNAKVDPNPTEPYTWTVTATDTDGILGTLTYSLDSVSPTPANGFTINATTGVVSWDPTCEDIGEGDTTYTITVSVSDGCASDEGNFVITLLSEQCEPCYGHTAPKNVSLKNLTAIAGQAYIGTVTADDDDNDTLTFAFSDGYTPPEGMTIDSATGVISWTPGLDDICYCSQEQALSARQQSKEAVNSYVPCNPIRITVSDQCGFTDEDFCVEVQSPCVNNEGPYITVPGDKTVDPNPITPYSWTVTATDPDGILGILTFSLDSVSPTPTNDFSVNATTGEVTWDPDCTDIVDRADTTYTVTVSVSDGCASVQDSFNVILLSEYCQTYTVTFVAGDNGSITGTDEFPGILSGTAWGDAVTVPTPVPDSGYEFDNWTPSFPATVTESATYTANFKEAGDITINYVANTGGSVNPASETLAPATGVAQGSTATPATGYVFVNWTDASDTEVGTDPLFVPEKVGGLNVAATYYANFEAIPTYTVTFVAGDNGSITGTDEFPGILSGTAWADAVTVPTPVPDSGYEFDNWTPSFPATVTADATFTANFKANPCCNFYFFSQDTRAMWHGGGNKKVRIDYHIVNVCKDDTFTITAEIERWSDSKEKWLAYGDATFITSTANNGGIINGSYYTEIYKNGYHGKEWRVRITAESNTYDCDPIVEGWESFD